MAALQFPANPANGDTHGDFTFDGEVWVPNAPPGGGDASLGANNVWTGNNRFNAPVVMRGVANQSILVLEAADGTMRATLNNDNSAQWGPMGWNPDNSGYIGGGGGHAIDWSAGDATSSSGNCGPMHWSSGDVSMAGIAEFYHTGALNVHANSVSFNNHPLNDVGLPSQQGDAANKQYVDNVAMGSVSVGATEFYELLVHPIEVDVDWYLEEHEQDFHDNLGVTIDIHDEVRWDVLHDLLSDGWDENAVLEVMITPVDVAAVLGGDFVPSPRISTYSLAYVSDVEEMPVTAYVEQDYFLRIFGEMFRKLENIDDWLIPVNPMVAAWVYLSESQHSIMLYVDVEAIHHVQAECDIPLAAMLSFEISSIKVVKR
jgi:hypothetical protein